jgi:hypothetical protein
MDIFSKHPARILVIFFFVPLTLAAQKINNNERRKKYIEKKLLDCVEFCFFSE